LCIPFIEKCALFGHTFLFARKSGTKTLITTFELPGHFEVHAGSRSGWFVCMAPSLIDELLALFPGCLTFGWAVAEIFLTVQ
jgi:hypothetical protein